MKSVCPWQIRKIHTIGGVLGLKSQDIPDELHLLIRKITGKQSTKKLTFYEAEKVISELERLQGGASTKYKSHPGGPTNGQQRKVWALMYQLKQLDTEPNDTPIELRLCGAIREILKIDVSPVAPFAWMDQRSVNRLIEMLKRYVRSAQKKTRDADGLHRSDHTG